MKAAVDAAVFSEALIEVCKVLKRSCIPVLNGVSIQFSGGLCTLTATDMDTWLTIRIPSQGDDFAFVLDRAPEAARACRHFEGELSIEIPDFTSPRPLTFRALLRAGRRTAEFEAAQADEFPAYPELKHQFAFRANAAALLKRVERVRYATLRSDANAQKTNIQFCGSSVYALDGVRMAWDDDPGLTFPQPFMAPVEALSYLKLFGSRDVEIDVGYPLMRITDGSTIVTARNAGALVFEKDKAIPREFREEFFVDPKEFLRELTYLKEAAPKGKAPFLRFCGGSLSVNTAAGRFTAGIPIEGTSEIVIGFVLTQLADALTQFRKEERVRMKLLSPLAPAVIEAEGRSDCALLMPVRLRDEEMRPGRPAA